MTNNHCEDDYGLQTLLDLNGMVYYYDDGYWIKFEAWQVEPSDRIPHGIKYSLTLHDKKNIRIVGYDNAHHYKSSKRKRYKARKVTWDHFHKREKVFSYEFDSASQLMEDFWKTVKEYK